VKDGNTFLDVGCCVGQDIRKLVFDGAPSENTVGSDLRKDFMEIGYNLFLDKSTLKTRFIGADIFDTESELTQLAGKVDIIHTAFFFHLFNLEGQTQAVRRVLTLFKDKVGCLLVGRQLGNKDAGLRHSFSSEEKRFRHNPESFAQMWKKVGDETGTEWKVDASLNEEDLWAKAQKEGLDARAIPPGSRVLNFTVRRVA
jgi:SAM-dependent methyltransferase